VSAQRPTHSLVLAGQELPLEARMGGIFLGFLCAVCLLGVVGRLRATRLPAGWLAGFCLALVVLTAADGLNAFLFDGGLPHLYTPGTPARLLTGLGAGLGLGLLAVPVVAGVVWRKPLDEPALADPLELLVALVAVGLLGAVLLIGPAPLLWPAAILMLLSVVVAFGLTNLYLLTLVGGRSNQAIALSDLSGPLLSAVGLALVELAGLSALRTWLATTFNLTWGF
jgi:uncharacterized membrane protein